MDQTGESILEQARIREESCTQISFAPYIMKSAINDMGRPNEFLELRSGKFPEFIH